ncbi:MAG: c-type cytochrome [Polyangiaceae bacterium]|nr:c-type cytochrome [Polyangiaceae bacterium]
MDPRDVSRWFPYLTGAATAVLLVGLHDVPRAEATEPGPVHASRASARSGAAVFESSCATCHGADGRGAAQSQVGFDVTLPDFSDCSFATREPNSDWSAIIHKGGPVRAFDEKMPAFGEALSDDEIQAVIEHVRTFCADDAWPRGELNFPRAIVTEKAFPEDEVLLSTGSTLEGNVEIAGKLILEKRVGARGQVEAVIPYGVRQRDRETDGRGGWAEGVGDIAFGAKYVLFDSLASQSILSLAGEAILPTGDESDGYGKDTVIFEPFVAYGQGLGSLGFVQLQAGTELPTKYANASNEGYGRLVLGRTFTTGRFGGDLSPMIELVAAGELDNMAAFDWDCVPELQITLSRRGHVRANVGVSLPVTGASERPTELLGYLLWDWFDGGLDEGW